MSEPDRDVDIAIVGAGVAGLTAARRATAAGVSVVVLEAREDVGGRTLDRVVAGTTTELGGQWVGPGQARVVALIDELGLETFPTYADGENLIEWRGRLRRYRGTVPRGLGLPVLLDLELTRRRLDRTARAVDPERPWTGPRAPELDALTLGGWLRRVARTESARELVAIACRTIWGAGADELGLLGVLAVIRSAGGFDALVDVEGGAQQDRVAGGSQRIALELAAGLGDRVVLDAPVTHVVEESSSGTLTLDAGSRRFRAGRAIVAVPPPQAARIRFAPALPSAHRRLRERMPGATLWKVVAAYEEPFWRGDGLSGEAVSDRGPVTIVYDNSPAGGRPGMLVGFVGASDATAFGALPAGERRAAASACFARLFGPRAGAPVEYAEQDWAGEPWIGGGPVFMPAPGALTAYGEALRAPAGRVHWAGTETSPVWTGYLDGAVRSGERAAAEAVAALG